MFPCRYVPAYWWFQRQKTNLSENRLVVFNGKSPVCTSGEHFRLIMKYQQGGKVMHASVFKTRTTCNHKLIAKFSQPCCWRRSGDGAGWGWPHEPKPVVPVQQHLMNWVPHPAGVGWSCCPLGPLRTRRVCSVSVRQRLMMRSCLYPS